MRVCLTAAVLGLGLIGTATAQSYGYDDYGYYNQNYRAPVDRCAKQTKDKRTNGAVVGGLIGALAGGVIGNNIDDDNDHRYRRGYRGHRGHYGYGRHHRNNDNSDNVAAGVIIGGLLGAVAGSEVGRQNSDCQPYHDSIHRNYQYAPGVAPPSRHAPAITQSETIYRAGEARQIRSYPARSEEVYREEDLYGGLETCETLTRVTRLPDGREIREQVQDCDAGEVFYERDGERVQGGY